VYKILLISLVSCALTGCSTESGKQNHTTNRDITENENKAAENSITAFLSNPKQPLRLDAWSSDFMSCGPHLWTKIKDDYDKVNPDPNTISFVMKTATLDQSGNLLGMRTNSEAKSFRDVNDVKLLWNVVLEETGVHKDFSIRKPTDLEMKLLIKQIPFIIEDPVLVVEAERSHLILIMSHSNGHYRPIWVDDLYGVNQ